MGSQIQLSEPRLPDAGAGNLICASEDKSVQTARSVSKKGSFVEDVLKMAGGMTSAQAASILASPILMRIYSPEDFGISTLFAAIEVMLGAFACMRYERSILLPERDEEAANALGVSLIFVIVLSLCTIPLVWLGGPWLLRLLKAPELLGFLWLLPPAVLINGADLALVRWNIRKEKFGRISILEFLNALCTISAQISLGLATDGNGGMLIIANLFGLSIATATIGFFTWRDSADVFRNNVSGEGMLYILKRYSRFPKYGLVSSLLDRLAWQMPSFLLSGFFSTGVVGEYALGNRVIRVPMSLMGTSIANVFSQRAADARNKGFLANQAELTFQYLISLSMFPCLLLAVIGKDVFVVLFGQRWGEAGVYTQILSVWLCFWFISVPLSSIFSVLEQQHLELRFTVLVFVSRLSSFLLGGFLGSARLAVLLFSGSGALIYAYYCLVLLTRAGVPLSRLVKVLLLNLAYFVPAGLIIGTLHYFSMPALVIVAVSCILLLAYYSNLVRVNPVVREWIGMILQKFSTQRCSSTTASI